MRVEWIQRGGRGSGTLVWDSSGSAFKAQGVVESEGNSDG